MALATSVKTANVEVWKSKLTFLFAIANHNYYFTLFTISTCPGT